MAFDTVQHHLADQSKGSPALAKDLLQRLLIVLMLPVVICLMLTRPEWFAPDDD